MANKYVALLLVVCLVAAASVDAQTVYSPTHCVDSCLAFQCGENPSFWCKFLCNFGCASTGMENENKVQTYGVRAEAPESSWAEAPQFSRKVKEQLEKDYKGEMQGFH